MASGGTTLANAYIQILPSAEGIKGKLQSVMGKDAESAGASAGKLAGLGMGKKMIAALGALGIGAAVGKFFAGAISEGAKLQQSIGGVETLYGGAANAIKGYASQAYQYGLTANEYMEQSTSFAAALKQSLGGDVKAAAEAANTALEDMADNSAKLGTPIESLQTAYQGFAKQNYTMLDNLKLGYGGTKSEMERLLAKAQEITGVEYNIDNLSDVYSAIHVIQDNLGMAGVAATEAKTTFSGSFDAMKAAAQNFMGALTTGGDVSAALSGLASTVSTFLFSNLIPMIGTIVRSIPPAIKAFIQEGIPQIIEGAKGLISDIVTYFSEHKEEIKETAKTMIQNFIVGITEKVPEVISNWADMLDQSLSNIKGNPETTNAGLQLVANLIVGLLKGIPKILLSVGKIVVVLLKHLLTRGIPAMLKGGLQLIKKVAAGLLQGIPDVVAKIPVLIQRMLSALRGKISQFFQVGKDIVLGIARGIMAAPGKLIEAAKNAAQSALDAIKRKLGIGSPSKVFASEVGRWIPAGIAKGILANSGAVQSALDGVVDPSALGLRTAAVSATYSGSNRNYTELMELLRRYLPMLQDTEIVLNDGTIAGVVNRRLGAIMG